MIRPLIIAIVIVGCLAGAQTAGAVAPETTITSGPPHLSLTNDNTPTFEFSADQPASFACAIDAAEPPVAFACASPFTLTPLPDGVHSFTVVATNAAAESDASPARRDFTVDATPPETAITAGPADGEVINDDAPKFAWGSSEIGSTFFCTADGVALASCEQAFATGASDGKHSFAVVATDPAGNTDPTPATRTFTVSLSGAPPELPRCPLDGNVIVATNNDDTRTGNPGTDIINGLGGDDLLRGVGGADCVSGASGDDRLFGGAGNDFVFGGAGADRIAGDAGNDEIYGDAGSDRITGGTGRDLLDGGAGADRLSDSSGRDTFAGGSGNDRIEARDASRAGRLISDNVACGSGRFDIAVVDRRDRVARNCERVRRR